MKRTITLLTLALAMTSVRASVALYATNFPDEGFRDAIAWADEDGNGVLSDQEIASIEQLQLSSPTSLKGLEYLTNIRQLDVYTDGSDDSPSNTITTFDGSILPHLFYLSFGGMNGLKSIDLSKNTELEQLNIYQGAKNLATLKLPASITMISLVDTPLLTTLDVSRFQKLQSFTMTHTGITDLDFSNHPEMGYVGVYGDEDKDVLNSLNLENCTSLENVDIRYTTIKSLTMKHLPTVRTLMMLYNDITTITIDDCEVFNDITCDQNVLGTLYMKNNPQLHNINCQDNQLQVLIADNCPQLYRVQAFNNRLMWLDLKDVKKEPSIDESIVRLDNQQPTVQAVKISPTEVGLRVHERLDVSRVLNLRAKGISQTPKEIFVDGIRYFVFYNNGPDTPNLVGSDCFYEYDTKWPYAWMDGNSKDNNLPVTLNVASWTKHQAFLTLSETLVKGKYSEPAPKEPTVTRSQDYDGKITFTSSNENVVKVDPETGVLTVVGAGTAVISVIGAETDYRLAPAVVTYTVIIDKASPVFAFEQAAIEAEVGKAVPENKLTIQMYDGAVQYTSSNEELATVDANGVVTAKAEGEVTIIATGPETLNCFEAMKAEYKLTIKGEGAGVSSLTLKAEADKAYDLQGRKLNTKTARKGVVIVDGRKVVR